MKKQISLKEQNIMIKLENVNKYYQSGDEKVHALKNITLNLPYTGLIFVLGQSGCGKSTLLNVLGGLDKPEIGRILVEGADFSKFTSAQHNNYLNSYLGFIFQEYNILKDLNLYDNIALPLEMQHIDKKEIKRRTNEIIDLVGLSELKKRKINQLSGGQRQRIAVARALIKNPKLIIADEPTGNLDSVTGETIFELLKQLSNDRLIVIVSHDEESAYKYGDRIIKIEDGTLVDDINAPFGPNDHNPLLKPNIDDSIKIVNVTTKTTSNRQNEEIQNIIERRKVIETYKFEYKQRINLLQIKIKEYPNNAKEYKKIIKKLKQKYRKNLKELKKLNANYKNIFDELYLDNDNLVLTKVTVPVKTSLKLALKNINHKKFRFILMMIICALSLAFFSFTIELNDDVIRQNVYTSVENGYLYADVLEKIELPEDYVKTSIYDDYIGSTLEAGSYEEVRKAASGINIHEYQNVAISILTNTTDRFASDFYPGEIQYYTKYDSRNTYDVIVGRTPIEGMHEIMVTDYLISMFEYFDFFDKEDNLSNYIGKYLQLGTSTKYRICGIVNTKYENYLDLLNNTIRDGEEKLYYAYMNEYKAMNTVFLDSNDYQVEKSIVMYKLDLAKSNITIVLKSNRNELGDADTAISNNIITTDDVAIKTIQKDTTGYYTVGKAIDHTLPQITVPYSVYSSLYGKDVGEPISWENYRNVWNSVKNKTITIEITSKNQTHTIEAEIVGINSINNETIGVSEEIMNFVFENGPKANSLLLAEMSTFGDVAYSNFKTAYRSGYIIDLFAYREDIDSYEISPFVNLLSKAGLFIFAFFTIGILWTIISLDIVDSKKEIGTFRSIGLSGGKVSLVFIFQTLIICLFSYVIAIIIGNIAINMYNDTIYDNLNLIHLSMYMLTYRSPIYLLAFLAVITTLALFLPLYKIMRQKIIDVINERGEL